MKVTLITPWDNAWVPYYKQAFEARGHEFQCVKHGAHISGQDLVLHGWASGASQPVSGARNVMFLRRYELFDGGLQRVNWKDVDTLVCVNTWIKGVVEHVFQEHGVKTPVRMIYNGTDPGRWTFKNRKANHRIGMACHVHPKKNLPLALQVLACLPAEYELHVAGDIQDACTAEYLNHVARSIKRKVYLYGHVERLNTWWEIMGVCLSTSLSEGNPNNVIEAMAKGLKPVVHAWPGSEDQFSGYLFNTAQEAAGMILDGAYESQKYLQVVKDKFSLANIERVVDLALEAA